MPRQAIFLLLISPNGPLRGGFRKSEKSENKRGEMRMKSEAIYGESDRKLASQLPHSQNASMPEDSNSTRPQSDQ